MQTGPLRLAIAIGTGLGLGGFPTTLSQDPFAAYGDLCTPEMDYAEYVALLEAIYSASNGLPQSRPAVVMAFDPQTSTAKLSLRAASGSDEGAATAGEPLRVVLTLTDQGRPVIGQEVAGWLQQRRNAQTVIEMPCEAQVKSFAQGRVTARADVDLNASRLLVLNRSGSISVIDPQVDFAITQMQAVIPLPGVPADWALSRDGGTLFVSLPVYAAVAVIDTATLSVATLIELDKGTMPTTLIPLRNGRLAVFLSGTGEVSVLTQGAGSKPPRLPVGSGPVAMVEDRGDRLFVVAAEGRLTSIDTRHGSIRSSRTLVAGEPSVAFNPATQTVYATTTGASVIGSFDAATLAPGSAIAAGVGIWALAQVPGDGHLVGVNRAEDRLVLIDEASNLIAAEVPTVAEPVELAFSDDYLYVRGLAADHFAVIDRAGLQAGELRPVNVQSGAFAVRPREALAHARMIAPYGMGAMVANSDEGVAYYYMEGMNTPMGTVQIYGRDVQGVLGLDRGFRETAPGVYEAPAEFSRGGIYDAALAIGGTDMAICTGVSVASSPAQLAAPEPERLTAEPVFEVPPLAGSQARVVVRIADAKGDPIGGLGDVRLVAFASAGGWQARRWAEDLGDGRYAADWSFPKAGRYGLSVEIASHHLGFADRPPLFFKVAAASATAPQRESSQ